MVLMRGLSLSEALLMMASVVFRMTVTMTGVLLSSSRAFSYHVAMPTSPSRDDGSVAPATAPATHAPPVSVAKTAEGRE